MPKSKEVARIPEDLRAREDLTLAQVNRVVHLRKQLKALAEKEKSLEDEIDQVQKDAKAAGDEVFAILQVKG
jgi:hypothetical protein